MRRKLAPSGGSSVATESRDRNQKLTIHPLPCNGHLYTVSRREIRFKDLTEKLKYVALLAVVLFAAGCPRGGSEFSQGKKAEAVQDYDTALIHYQQALQADPTNPEYKLKAMRLRFEAG